MDVHAGSGWLNYINGYVDKAADAMDFRVKEHYKDADANAPWRQTYRLLSKKTPLLSEVYIAMKKRPKMIRSFVTDVLYPVIPGRVDIRGPKATKYHRLYAAYLDQSCRRVSADASVADPSVVLGHGKQECSLVEYCRGHQWDEKANRVKQRNLASTGKQVCAVGVNFEFEL